MTTQKGYPNRSPCSHLAQNLLTQNNIRTNIYGIFYAYGFISFKTACVSVPILDDFVKKKYLSYERIDSK